MTKSIYERAADFIEPFEGFSATAYRCPAGVLTIGYGHTADVKEGDTITKAAARKLMIAHIKRDNLAIDRYVKVKLTDNQRIALLSFVYNLGEGNLKSSTLLKELNKGKFDRVPHELNKWVKDTSKGKPVTLKGLVKRRAAEGALFAEDWDEPITTGVEVKRATSPVMSKENASFGVGIAAAVATPIAEISSDAAPIQYAIAAIMVVGFVVGLVYFIKRRGA
jgi:lysozyme